MPRPTPHLLLRPLPLAVLLHLTPQILIRLLQNMLLNQLLRRLPRRALHIDLLLRLAGPAAALGDRLHRQLGDSLREFRFLGGFDAVLLGLVGFVVLAVVVGREPVAQVLAAALAEAVSVVGLGWELVVSWN
jgi:hypothetical protein